MPLRLVIIGLLIALIFIKYKRFSFNYLCGVYLLFTIIYFGRLIFEINIGNTFYIDIPEIFKFYFTFSLIPFISISCFLLTKDNILSLEKAILYSGLLFSVAVIYFYSKYIGVVSRLASNFVEDQVISPLVLSYCSILIFGIFLSNLIFKNFSNKFTRNLYVLGIILSFVPFLLGASRGSLIALFASILFIITFGNLGKVKVRLMISGVFLIIIFIVLDGYFNSGILNRFGDISSQSQDSNSRTFIWKSALNQFANNPFFGDKLKIDNWDGYAHNILIEVLYTTGIFGAIPFLILLISGFKMSIKIIKMDPKLSWVSVMFIQSVFQFMFSGNLYIAAWFWLSLALIISINKFLIRAK